MVIAGGQSVTDYDKNQITLLAKAAFTFGVNGAIFAYPCDTCVIMDPLSLYPALAAEAKRLNIPVVCRNYPGNDKYGIDLIEVPMDTIRKYPTSGMAAAKLSDLLAVKCEGRSSYVIGIDATKGNYPGYHTGKEIENDPHDREDLKMYEDMRLEKTINLSIHSRVSCWPKISKLPNIKKVVVNTAYKITAMAWLRAEGKNLL